MGWGVTLPRPQPVEFSRENFLDAEVDVGHIVDLGYMLAVGHMLAAHHGGHMNGLTALQENCLRLIRDYIRREQRSPTRRELAKLTGQKSTHGVTQILGALQRKGYIRLEPPGKSRNIVVVRTPVKQLALIEEAASPVDSSGVSK